VQFHEETPKAPVTSLQTEQDCWIRPVIRLVIVGIRSQTTSTVSYTAQDITFKAFTLFTR